MKYHRNRKTMRRHKKMKGGASFNQTVCFNDLPRGSFYDQNVYGGDPSRAPFLQDARLMTGGSKRRRQRSRTFFSGKQRRRKRSMKTFSKSRKGSKLQKGGGVSVTNSDLLLGSSAARNVVFGAGASAGTGLNYSMVSGSEPVQGGPPIAYNANNPSSVAMV